MNQDYIQPNSWSIIEEGFDAERVRSSESLFSIGNGAMGQRANFEEQYSGATFQGSYIAGVYYPDKTKVGWWKNGYPEYFAKVLNAPNWIGIDVYVNEEKLDLFTCNEVKYFSRELNMKEGWYLRTFEATLKNGVSIKVSAKRFLSIAIEELGAIAYTVTPINTDAIIGLEPYLNAGIANEDTNWDDKFWDVQEVLHSDGQAFINARTMKTEFNACTFMQSQLFVDGKQVVIPAEVKTSDAKIGFNYEQKVAKGSTFSVHKYGGYVVDRKYAKETLKKTAKSILDSAIKEGFSKLLAEQKEEWSKIWKTADITIDGDVKAQQGIRFNIFHLNQTYLGNDSSLNIGPKGFTGEKYGGSTYWDTEAYCLPFYMATKNQEVARNLLSYRYKHLEKAIENAEKLGFKKGAALYPMVTMNGEECHNEWEITFEEIHRNGAIAYAIHNYVRYTGDFSYVQEMGMEVLIGIARFWQQRATFSANKNQYVILGVTGPNEYENNVNNNWYTNYLAKWCLTYAAELMTTLQDSFPEDYNRIVVKTNFIAEEKDTWLTVSNQMYLPYSEKEKVYLQQDGFLDKELISAKDLESSERPINQKWSWDRILRSPYIKQADILQGFYFFEEAFTKEELEQHFDFYEPFTVHESSLSPCVHCIQAASLGRMTQAYSFYLRTSRLDLDDYNNEVEEGLHITSMAGTWMSIVEGFGGMRVKDGKLSFTTQIPEQWEGYSFKVNFRNQIVKIEVTHHETIITVDGTTNLDVILNGMIKTVAPKQTLV